MTKEFKPSQLPTLTTLPPNMILAAFANDILFLHCVHTGCLRSIRNLTISPHPQRGCVTTIWECKSGRNRVAVGELYRSLSPG